MRLALLAPLPPEQTGIADYAAHFAAALRSVGVEVTTPLVGRCPIDTIERARVWVAQQDWSAIDVVHAELGGGRFGEFLVLCALAERPDRPALSATIHDPERLIWKPVNPFWNRVEKISALPAPIKQAIALLCDPVTLAQERRLAGKLDGLVALTQTGASCLGRRMKLPVERVSVIPHGVLSFAQTPLPNLDAIRLLYFGFIYSGKGIEDLIDALARVCARLPHAAKQLRLTIAGGTAPDIAFGNKGSYLDHLREMVQQRGLSQQVSWTLDVAENQVAELIAQHHVMVLPYRESRKLSFLGQMRGTSGALAWAIACGRGAITSNARAFAEEIRQGNGTSYNQGDVGELASRIESLLQDPEVSRRWASQASTVAAERAWSATAHRFLMHFEKALTHRARVSSGHAQAVSASCAPKESV